MNSHITISNQASYTILVLFIIFWCFIAYCIGGILFGQIISKLKNIIIRKTGSSNVGSTNVSRSLGIKFGLLVLVLDALKSYVSILICLFVCSFIIKKTALSYIGSYIGSYGVIGACFFSGFCALLGHCFPLKYLIAKIKKNPNASAYSGGKGAACYCGIVMAFSPWLFLMSMIIFAIIFFCFRYVSLASIITCCVGTGLMFITLCFDACGFISLLYLFDGFKYPIKNDWTIMYLGCFVALTFISAAIVVVIRHKANIIRILNHTETKFTFRNSNQSHDG